MAIASPTFDITPCIETDVPGCHASEEERETRANDDSLVLNINAGTLQIGRDNVLNFKSVHDSTPSENPSEAESSEEGGPVLREHWKPRGR